MGTELLASAACCALAPAGTAKRKPGLLLQGERMARSLKPALLAAVIAVAACGSRPDGAVTVQEAWARETIGEVAVSAGYGRIENGTDEAVRLVGAEAPVAGRIEIHNVANEGGVMRMHELAAGLEVPAGASIELRPGGYHLMLLDLRRPLRAGEAVPVTLRFDGAPPLQADFAVRSAADAAAGGHSHE
jgi:copper(I)-binding protein